MGDHDSNVTFSFPLFKISHWYFHYSVCYQTFVYWPQSSNQTFCGIKLCKSAAVGRQVLCIITAMPCLQIEWKIYDLCHTSTTFTTQVLGVLHSNENITMFEPELHIDWNGNRHFDTITNPFYALFVHIDKQLGISMYVYIELFQRILFRFLYHTAGYILYSKDTRCAQDFIKLEHSYGQL